uniref:MULE domain-containing protein n=1 Tax=Brugia timori TaxID=42155 RepID=A0A0R3R4L3_9BILA
LYHLQYLNTVLFKNTVISTHFRYRLNSRFVEHRCPYLIPFMLFNETTQQYTIHTSVSIDIIKEIFYALKYENINVKDWLQLEQILKVVCLKVFLL